MFDGREGRGGRRPRRRGLLGGTEIRGERKRKIYGAARCRLTTGSVRLPTKPLLHAISSTILSRAAPFALRSLERPPPSSSLWLSSLAPLLAPWLAHDAPLRSVFA